MSPRPTLPPARLPPREFRQPEPARPAEHAASPAEFSLDFQRMLDQIDGEVARRMAAGADRDSAYAAAVPEVIKRLVEGRKAEAFEVRLIETLRRLSRGQGGRPVRTTRLATELGQSTWATWYYLTRLESRGLIVRPGGPKSGWMAR